MITEIIKWIFTFFGVYEDLIINPKMEDQPQIGISKPNFRRRFVEEREYVPKPVIVIDRILWLDFSIRYEIPKVDFIKPIAEHFDEEGKIILKKFYRVTPFRTYSFGKPTAPEEIKLPKLGKDEKFKGHDLLVLNCFYDDKGILLKTGSIHVSIFEEIEIGTLVTQELLKQAVSNFRCLLEIGEEEDSNQYAYQFSVETVTNKAMDRGMASRKVYTNMFKVVFDKDGCGLKVEYVDPIYYYTC